MNSESSRSHSVFTCVIESQSKVPDLRFTACIYGVLFSVTNPSLRFIVATGFKIIRFSVRSFSEFLRC